MDHEAEIHMKLAVLESILLDMKSRLFGNHQEGELEYMRKRLRKLERLRWIILGGAMVIATLISAVAGRIHVP